MQLDISKENLSGPYSKESILSNAGADEIYLIRVHIRIQGKPTGAGA